MDKQFKIDNLTEQLNQLKTENKSLKKQLQFEFDETLLQYSNTIEDLQQQLDQLKAENDTYKKMLEDEDVQLALTEIRSGERHLWRNKAEKLSKALTEIKEIAEQQCVCGVNCVDMKQILQKISEVIEDE